MAMTLLKQCNYIIKNFEKKGKFYNEDLIILKKHIEENLNNGIEFILENIEFNKDIEIINDFFYLSNPEIIGPDISYEKIQRNFVLFLKILVKRLNKANSKTKNLAILILNQYISCFQYNIMYNALRKKHRSIENITINHKIFLPIMTKNLEKKFKNGYITLDCIEDEYNAIAMNIPNFRKILSNKSKLIAKKPFDRYLLQIGYSNINEVNINLYFFHHPILEFDYCFNVPPILSIQPIEGIDFRVWRFLFSLYICNNICYQNSSIENIIKKYFYAILMQNFFCMLTIPKNLNVKQKNIRLNISNQFESYEQIKIPIPLLSKNPCSLCKDCKITFLNLKDDLYFNQFLLMKIALELNNFLFANIEKYLENTCDKLIKIMKSQSLNLFFKNNNEFNESMAFLNIYKDFSETFLEIKRIIKPEIINFFDNQLDLFYKNCRCFKVKIDNIFLKQKEIEKNELIRIEIIEKLKFYIENLKEDINSEKKRNNKVPQILKSKYSEKRKLLRNIENYNWDELKEIKNEFDNS